MKKAQENQNQDARMVEPADSLDSRTASADTVLSASVSPDHVSNEVVHITPELRAILEKAVRESEALRDVPYEMVGPRTFRAVKGKGVVFVSQMDSLGRRHTNVCELNVSPGLDPVAFAVEIVSALNGITNAPTERGSDSHPQPADHPAEYDPSAVTRPGGSDSESGRVTDGETSSVSEK